MVPLLPGSRLYHGSIARVEQVDVGMGALNKDFGRGFYTTSARAQAERFAQVKARRAGLASACVSVFAVGDLSGLAVQRFERPDEPWFNFVLRNRGFSWLAPSVGSQRWDIVTGPVANDAVGLVLNQFVAGVFGPPETAEAKATAIRLLLTQRLHDQVFFATAAAAGRLVFQEAFDVRVG